MTCPVCGAKTKILDSRKHIDYVRRRRECVECGYRFTTEETEVRTSHKNRQKNHDRAEIFEKIMKHKR